MIKFISYFLLPPANEVWGKVICLQACVLPRGRGRMVPGGCMVPGGAWFREVPAPRGVGVHGPGGPAPGGGGGCLVETSPPTATAAGGTHPTGMHSCWVLFLPPVMFFHVDYNTLRTIFSVF